MKMLLYTDLSGRIYGLNVAQIVDWQFDALDGGYLTVWTGLDPIPSPREYWGEQARTWALALMAMADPPSGGAK